jgi:hypothetical protein
MLRGMAEPLSITILRKKRDQVRNMVAAYEAKLKEAQSDLAHIIATLRLFEVAGEPADFPPYVDLNRVFRRGETTAICRSAIEKEGPLDTRQLTERVMASKGMDKNDRVLWNTIALRVVQTMRCHAMKGRMDNTLRRKGVIVWQLPGEWRAKTQESHSG